EQKRSAKGLYEEIRFSDDIALAQMESAGNFVTYYENLDQLVDEHVEQGWNREEVLFDLEFVRDLDLEDMEKDFILVDKDGVEGGEEFNECHSVDVVGELINKDNELLPHVSCITSLATCD